MPSISHYFSNSLSASNMVSSVTESVNFDTVAREWQMKWSGENDSKSLQEAQKALEAVLPAIKALDGFKSVQRVVCGGCFDFKVKKSN